jgi:hypothetical protein
MAVSHDSMLRPRRVMKTHPHYLNHGARALLLAGRLVEADEVARTAQRVEEAGLVAGFAPVSVALRAEIAVARGDVNHT